MSRYSGSWGYFPHRRPSSVAPPYPIMVADPMHITDEDFQYITSEDIINHNSVQSLPQTISGSRRGVRGRSRPRSVTPPPEDDVLIIKNKGVTYPAHFEAYSIYDEQVLVRDVQDKIGEMMELSPEATRDVKLLYKGSNMSDPDIPVKSYGVKNNSEILAVVREAPRHRRRERDPREDVGAISSGSSEDVIVATDGEVNPLRRQKSRKFKRRPSRHGHRDSMASVLSLPNFATDRRDPRDDRRDDMRDERWEDKMEEWSPPQIQPLVMAPSKTPVVPGGALDKLDGILNSFETELVPICNEYMADPPTDAKKIKDEHTKLSETIFQQVLLKLDEVDTGGSDDARTRRKQLVKHTQQALKLLDDTKAAALQRAA